MNEEKEIIMAGGKSSTSQIPDFHLIPTESMIRLAERFKLGIERKGEKSWNAVSKNQEILTDKEFIINRIGHIIHHCLKLRDKITNNEDLSTDDDAGAISWGGAFLCCATKELTKKSRTIPPLVWGKTKCPEGIQGSIRPSCNVETRTTPESDKDFGNQTYEKEVQMVNGKYYLMNAVTLRVFGTKSFETENEAINEMRELEEKWKDKPLDRRQLGVFKFRIEQVFGETPDDTPNPFRKIHGIKSMKYRDVDAQKFEDEFTKDAEKLDDAFGK